MINTRLSLFNGTDWVDMPLTDNIPVSINYANSDVRSPESVKATTSKTINIPFSNESVKFFEWIFKANVELQTFNPNLKTDARIYHGSRLTTRGYCQLLKVNTIDDGTVKDGDFECNVIGETGNIFTDMGDMFLHELDLSDLNHTYDVFNQLGCPLAPAPTIGQGYAYPYVDYGLGNINNSTWLSTDLKPGIFEVEYLRRIFDFFGYTWTSNFLSSGYYIRRIVPCVTEGRLKLDSNAVNNSQFYAGKVTPVTGQIDISSYYNVNPFPLTNAYGTLFPNYWGFGSNPGSPTYAFSDYVYGGQLTYTDDTNSPFFDGSTVYNTGTSTFTSPINAYYEFGTENTFTIEIINAPAGAVSMHIPGNPAIGLNIEVLVNIVAVAGTVSTSTYNITDLTTLSATNPFTITQSVPNILVNLGNIAYVTVQVRAFSTQGIKFYDNVGVEVTGGTPQVRLNHTDGSFYGKITVADLLYGQTVDMNSTIPRDYKIKDFFKSIIQTFNLRIEPSKVDPYNLIIEPHYDFYNFSTNQLDWTSKLDVSQRKETIPMGDLDWKTLTVRYKQDSDYYNADYLSKTSEVYGQEYVDINNEFIKNDKVVEVIYSPTPIVKVNGSPMTVPKIYKIDSGTVKSMKANIRVLYWGGSLPCGNYTYNGFTFNTYPYAGHVDNPANPSLDINFDNPLILYWNLIGQTYTTNNIYNTYWKRYIEEITDPDSKIVRAWFYLDESDIAEFSFRNIVYVKDAYYYVNKIIDYNPLKKDTCQVELLKLKTAPAFVAEVIGDGGFGGGIGQVDAEGETSGSSFRIITENAGFNYAGNNEGYQANALGQNNINMGGLVIGEDNVLL